jgi:Sec-independent protein secretion pathway component TatC
MNHKTHDYSQVAVAATLHCLTGCAIGEILGMVIGNVAGLSNLTTILISTALAFVFGYSLSLMPLLKHGVEFKKAAMIVLAADTLSILSMEIADNAVMALVPGAMNANLVNPLFWATMPVSLFVGFLVAVPVNQYLLNRGKGHALMHESLHHG